MSDKNTTIIEKLKDLAKVALSTDEKVESKFMDVKTADGVILRYDDEELSVGVVMNIVDEAGMVFPAPVGSYVLEDGTSFDVVNEQGSIDNIVIAEVAENEPETEMEETTAAPAVAEKVAKVVTESVVKKTEFKEETPEAKVVEVEETVTTDQEFTAYKAENDKKIESLEASFAKQKELVESLFKLVEELGNEESAVAEETKKNEFKKIHKPTAKELKASFKAQLNG